MAPATVVWVRFALGVVILGGAVVARRQLAWPSWKEAGYFALLGVIGMTVRGFLRAREPVYKGKPISYWVNRSGRLSGGVNFINDSNAVPFLVKALKRHRRQSRAIQSTLASLKQLKTLGV